MNEEIKARWVSALRSGEYEQGTGYLQRNGKFCCLGVLCELAVDAGVVEHLPSHETREIGGYASPGRLSCDQTALPWAVVGWAGLNDGVPRVTDEGKPSDLVLLNDTRRYDFNQIADVIEQSL